MKITLLILIVALIAKDTSQLNDPYIMRGIAQGLCLIVGGLWLLANLSSELLRSYWPVFGYLAILLISATGTVSPEYVLLQWLSLAAVLIFFIAYFENQSRISAVSTATLMDTTVLLYTFVAVISLIVIFTHPAIAYGTMYNGDAGVENRFRGLFPKAGMLASAVGLAIGMAWFSKRGIPLKVIVIGMCAACLFLTLSRTFWVALVGAMLVTYWLYVPNARKWVALICLSVLSLFFLQQVFDLDMDISKAKFARAETFATLNGRVTLWEQGINAFKGSPFIGYGYTAGASGLAMLNRSGGMDKGIDEGRDIGRTTLHSGYLQSLLDSGLLGTFFYISILVVALYRLYRLDMNREYRAEFFVLIYLAIANISQNVIYSASVFDSLLFFAVAVFAMSLRKVTATQANNVAYHRIVRSQA